MTYHEENLQAARRAYRLATEAYWHERHAGGIVADEDPMSGRKFKAATPAGASVLGIWQKCKAELDAAAQIHQRECGDTSCAICDHTQRRMRSLPTAEQLADLRLPPGDRE